MSILKKLRFVKMRNVKRKCQLQNKRSNIHVERINETKTQYATFLQAYESFTDKTRYLKQTQRNINMSCQEAKQLQQRQGRLKVLATRAIDRDTIMTPCHVRQPNIYNRDRADSRYRQLGQSTGASSRCHVMLGRERQGRLKILATRAINRGAILPPRHVRKPTSYNREQCRLKVQATRAIDRSSIMSPCHVRKPNSYNRDRADSKYWQLGQSIGTPSYRHLMLGRPIFTIESGTTQGTGNLGNRPERHHATMPCQEAKQL